MARPSNRAPAMAESRSVQRWEINQAKTANNPNARICINAWGVVYQAPKI